MGIYLPKPNKDKSSSDGENKSLKYGVSAMQGWRTSMEDAHITEVNFTDTLSLFAVFDGHGGPEVAKFCAKFFPEQLKSNPKLAQNNYKEALEETFLKMDVMLQTSEGGAQLKLFRSPDAESGPSSAGCTAMVVLFTPTEVYFANAGDSRGYVFNSDNTVSAMSRDHKPDLEAEKNRITKAGGYVSEGRVNDNLNLTRAIGDLDYKKNKDKKPTEQIIIALPEIQVYKIDKKPKFVILGCDGIWETLTAKDICEKIFARLTANPDMKLSAAVEELLDRLLAKDTIEGTGCDNMSCILVKFK